MVYNHTAEAGTARADAGASAVSTTWATTSAWCYRPPTTTQPPPVDTYWDVTGCGNTVDATHT